MLHYILQVVAFQLVFLLGYDLFLKKETFHKLNRAYLLGTPLASFILPFLSIASIQEQIPVSYFVALPTVIIGDAATVNTFADTITSGYMDFFLLWEIGAGVAVLLFIYKLVKLQKLRLNGVLKMVEGFKIVEVPESKTAFSFLNTIYLGATISEAQKESILLHEMEHVKGKHSLDLLYFEAIKIIFWFNPLSYTYQSRMRTLQEFIADEKVIATQSKSDYYQSLLSQVFGTENISFINTFFNHSLIKKRIIMLQKSKSNRLVQLKYLVLIPMFAGMLVYTSCSNEADQAASETAALTTDTEVMQKIVELSEAMMKKGNLTPEEEKALKFLTTDAESGDKVYTSIQEFLDDPDSDKIEYVSEVKDGDGIPFSVIEKVPVFPGCETLNENASRKNCFSLEITKRIQGEFDTSLADNMGLSGVQQIYVQFKIGKKGFVKDVKARAPTEVLKQEAIRVIEGLPQMTPGEHKGQAVTVLYALPIKFKIEK